MTTFDVRLWTMISRRAQGLPPCVDDDAILRQIVRLIAQPAETTKPHRARDTALPAQTESSP